MDPEKALEEVFMASFKKEGLDGKLNNNQIVALLAVCNMEMGKELEAGITFVQESPSKEAVLETYKKERAKDPNLICAEIETNSSVDIGNLTGIVFIPAMWEVVKACRLIGHMYKLDIIGNYYASKWGNAIDGPLSIDAEIGRSSSAKGSSGCLVILMVTLIGIGLLSLF